MPNIDDGSYTDLNALLGLDTRLTFMNHGYYPIDERAKDFFLETSASLYIKLMSMLDIQASSLLEIGCGRGGGVDLIDQLYDIPDVAGFDYNYDNVRSCNKMFPHLKIYMDDAERPHKLRKKYDVIINVESSHCYHDVPKFFDTVSELLSPDGRFLYGDCFNEKQLIIAEEALHQKFQIIDVIDITENTAASCKHMAEILDDTHAIKTYYKTMYRNKYPIYANRDTVFKLYMCKK